MFVFQKYKNNSMTKLAASASGFTIVENLQPDLFGVMSDGEQIKYH